MIIGYQIEDKFGRNWHDNIDLAQGPRTVLTENTAVSSLKMLRERYPERGFRMFAVLKDDIVGPFFEWELSASEDQYKVIGISTGHLSEEDKIKLNEMAHNSNCGMVTGRDTGWFIKLYNETEYNTDLFSGFSEQAKKLLDTVYKSGFTMVEFDCDATVYEVFKLFEQID